MSHVAVIGGGIAGLCSAWYLRKEGFDVTVVDRDSAGQGCSWGNAGMIVPSHFIPLASPGMPWKGFKMLFRADSPFAITPRLDTELIRWAWTFFRRSNPDHVKSSMDLLWQMNHESGLLYEEFSRSDGFDFHLEKKGLIVYCHDDDTLRHEKKVAQKANQVGAVARIMDRDQLQQLDPGVQLNVTGGVYYPGDAFFEPGIFMKQLRTELRNNGVQFVNRSIHAIQTEGNRAHVEGLEADNIVIAAGVWSSALASTLGLRIPMQGGKGYSFTLESPAQIPNICSILIEARIAVTPMNGKLRFAGTMQLDGTNESISRKRLEGIKRSIPKYFPEFGPSDFKDLDTWVGLRPCSPDGLPYVGKVNAFNNLFVATGGAMMGMSLGPWMGKEITEIIVENKSQDPKLDPDRF